MLGVLLKGIGWVSNKEWMGRASPTKRHAHLVQFILMQIDRSSMNMQRGVACFTACLDCSGLVPGDLDPSTSQHYLTTMKHAYLKLR